MAGLEEAIIQFSVLGAGEASATANRIEVDLTNVTKAAEGSSRAMASAGDEARRLASTIAGAITKFRAAADEAARLASLVGAANLSRALTIDPTGPTGLALDLAQAGAKGAALGIAAGSPGGPVGVALGAAVGGAGGIVLEGLSGARALDEAAKASQARINAQAIEMAERAADRREQDAQAAFKASARDLIEKAGGARLGAALNGQRRVP